MWRNLWNKLKNEEGSETVEAILWAPLHFMILAYIVCFSQLFYANHIALTAADVGCRTAITKDSAYGAKYTADNSAKAYVESSGMGITYKDSVLSYPRWDRGEVCTCTVTVEVETLMPLPSNSGFNRIQMVTRNSHMMIEKE